MTDASPAEGASRRGPALMTLSMLAFTLNDTGMKALAGEMPLVQALFRKRPGSLHCRRRGYGEMMSIRR